MKTKLTWFVLMFAIVMALPTLAQHETLGRVSFPTSCDPKVQPEFQRGVAMLHLYWFVTPAGRSGPSSTRTPAAPWRIGGWRSICSATAVVAAITKKPKRPGRS